MKLLVTGGCGFLGSNLADAAMQRGDDVTLTTICPARDPRRIVLGSKRAAGTNLCTPTYGMPRSFLSW